MPRKTSQSAAKDSTVAEGGAPRRSGRAATKQEPAAKDVNRSRRSSTAAQTAASVADSKSPKGRSGSSRRDSTSPSDGRGRTSREGVESPATRARGTRRNASRINYKESDGEEEAAAVAVVPKFDDNFVSGEEFDDSESDEKSKRGRGKAKAPAKGRVSKGKGASRGRKGRAKKEADEEGDEAETVEVDEGSEQVPEGEQEEVASKKGRAAKASEPPKSSRARGRKSDAGEEKAPVEKPKQSRRSSRGSTNKEETSSPRKRLSRGVQAKHYTEDEEEDIAEELSDSKAEEKAEETEEVGKKRKREDSPEEPSKRAKEEKGEPSEEEVAKKAEEGEDSKMEDEKEPEEKSAEEPMEVDETDTSKVSETPSKSETESDKMDEISESKSEDIPVESQVESSEKKELSTPVESKTVSKEVTPKSDQTSKSEESVKSSIDIPKNVNETAKVSDTGASQTKAEVSTEKTEEITKPASKVPEPMESKPSVDSNSATVSLQEKPAKDVSSKPEESSQSPTKSKTEIEKKSNVPGESKATPAASTTESPIPSTQSKEPSSDTSVNGEEKDAVSKPAVQEIHSNANLNSEVPDKSSLKANGAPNNVQHTNSTTCTREQYYSLPGRKYVNNSKLSDTLKQSVKSQTFGFLSFNLGTLAPDAFTQKEKLLNEINSMDAHLICLQQVAKPFYTSVLEPSLDALGFKGIFSQPENSLKGMATFYKNSLFRLSGKSEISLKQLIEKDVEASALDSASRAAVKNHIRRCGNVLFSHFSAVLGSQAITVANVQIPPTDLSIHALQVSCLAKEVIKMNGGSNKPLLIGGEFNIAENDASYQLLKDGYLSNEMIEELQRRKDVVLPEKENESLVNLLWKSFQHPSSNLCSCYTTVLGHEFVIPGLKITSPDLIWFSSDSLCTIGVLDADSGKFGDHHFSLKADIAFNI